MLLFVQRHKNEREKDGQINKAFTYLVILVHKSNMICGLSNLKAQEHVQSTLKTGCFHSPYCSLLYAYEIKENTIWIY